MAERRRALGGLAAAAALAVLAAAVVSLPPAQQAEAQTTITLVSNAGQTTSGNGSFLNLSHAQGFTTGSNSGGYTLTSIEATLTAAISGVTFRAELWSDNNGAPGSKSVDLTVPSSLVAGVNAFAAPENTTLSASTKYHFVIYSTGFLSSVGVVNTNTNNEDSGKAAGWTIADGSHFTRSNTPTGTWSSFGDERKITVKGYANLQSATTSSATTSTATTMASTTTTPTTMPTQSTDATLSGLSSMASTDGSTATGARGIVPAFASATEDYIATVLNRITHVAVTPTANHASATIEAGKGSSLTTVSSGSATSWIALDVGANEVNVKVTAQDGTTTKTYTIVVTRATTDSLVSNVGQLKQAEATALTITQANAFTTGSNAAGYTLTGIDFHVRATSSLTATHLSTLTASVWTSGGSAPSGNAITALGTKLADLTVPTSATTGVVTFAAPAGTTLAANTTYYVAIGSPTFTGDPNLQINTTTSDSEDAGSASGFSIANVSYSSGIAPWAQNGSSVALAFRVNGAAKTGVVTVSESSLAIAAGGGTATYTVALNSAPTANVTIAVASGTTAAATVSPATLTFTTSDYAAKTVTVTGVAAGWSTITHAASSTDVNYDAISGPPLAVRVDPANTVTLVGNTGQTAALAPSIDKKITNAFTTGSNAAGYTLSSVGFDLRVATPLTTADKTALKAQLWSDSSGDPGTKLADLTAPTDIMTGVVYFAAPSNTTLTASTTYHVLIEGGGKPRIVSTESNNEDAGGAAGWSIADVYQFLNNMNVWADHEFDEEIQFQVRGAAKTAAPGVTVSATSVSVVAGSTTTYTIKLNKAPTADVTVTPTSGTTGVATVTNQAKTFTSTNWSQTQTVTVTGVMAGSSTISHAATSTDTAYQGISIASVAATVTAAQTQSTDATLSALTGVTSTDGSDFTAGALTLDPTFDSTKTAYIATVENSVTHIKVTPTVNESNATVQAGKGSSLATVTSAMASAALALDVGANTINVKVTAQDGTTTKTYTITVTRAATDTLVSSVGQAPDPVAWPVTAATRKYAQPFTTGTNAAGYTLTSVGIAMRGTVSAAQRTALRVEVWTDSSTTPGTPGAKHADLTVPASVTAGIVSFAAPASTSLAASTTFHVVVYPATNEGSGPSISGTPSDNEDAGAASGWSIGNNLLISNNDAPYTANSSNEALRFQVKGSAKTAGTAPTTLTLTTDAASNTIAEDGGSVTVTATLNAAATAATSVTLSASGTATGTADYSLPSAFTIPVGSTSATGTVTIVDDMVDEDSETVILTTTVSGLSVTGVTLNITDNDTAGITVSSTAVGVVAGSTETYTVKLNTKPTASVTITPGSGTTGVATVSGALTFTTTNWSVAQEVTITGVTAGTSTISHTAGGSDSKYGSSLTLDSVTATVLAPSTLVSNTGQTVASAALQTLQGDTDFSNSFTTGSHSDGYTVTSVDVRISVNRQTMLNASELAALSVALYTNSGGNPGTKVADLTTPSSVAGGASIVNFTAPAGTHLSASTTYHLQIEGAGDQVAAIRVQRTSSDDEDSGGAAGWSIGNTARGRVVSSWAARTPAAAISFAVKGGARQPMYSAATPGVSVSETTRATEIGGTTTYTVVLDAQPTASVTVTPTSGATATATVSPATLTFTTTNWDRPQTVTVTGVAAASTTITHAASSTDTRYNGISIASVSVSVTASTKTVKFDPTTVSVGEGSNASVTVKLGRNAPAGGVALAFTYSYSGSTATTADTGTTPATLTVAAGQNTGTLSIPTTSDSLVEGDETFTVTVTTTTSGWEVVSTANQATVTITDDDDNNASVSFRSITATTKQTFTVTENVSGGTLRVPIVITDNPSVDTTFNVSVETGGTATEYVNAQNPGDFRIATKSVTFGPTTSRIQHLTITITNDALLEENQTIELKISDSTSGTIGALYTRHAMGRLAKVTITDDERTGARVAFGTNPASTSNHTASVDEDVTGNTLNVPVTINRIPESSITIPVTVLTASTHPASEWQSAQNLGDFRIVTKSVTFGPSDTLSSGTVSKNLAITINDDSLVEEDQRILVSIGDSATNNLGRHYTRHSSGRRAVVTIEDDEADEGKIAFGFAAVQTAASRVELSLSQAEGFSVIVPVTISAKPESDITVNITVVSAGTTATSADYSIATSSVTFGPGRGVDQEMTITITNDDLVEEDQTIKLRLAAAGTGLDRFYVRDTAETNDMNGTSNEATVTINDDERPDAKIAFHASNAASTAKYTATVDEDDGTISVPITITDLPESNTQFTVEVLAASTATEWTNAQNPGDYRVLNNKAVAFGPTSQKTQNVRIQLQNNALVEHPETVQLRIVAADTTPNDLGDHYDRHAQSRLATLTIDDDDAAAATIAIGTNAASMTKFTHSVDEDVTNGIYKIPIKVSHSPSVDTTFELQVLGTGTATGSGTDYSIATKTFTLTPTTTSATVDVTLTDDAWVEDDQTIEVRIKAADASGTTLEKYYTRHASGSLGQITIEDDEQRAAKVAFGTAARTTRYTADGEEVVGTLNVPIAINHLPESSTTFTVEVLSTGTARETDDPDNAMGNPKDFVIGAKTVTFGAATAKSMNLAVAIENDDVEEDDETIDLRIVAKDTTVDDLGDHYDRGGSESTVGAGATARVTVKSEDEVSSVKFTTNITGTAGVQGGDILLFEGQELVVTATADKYVGPGGWKVALTLRGWRSAITASPNDVTLPTFTIPEGAKTATGTVTIVTDTRTEQQELFHFGGNAKRKSRTVQATPTWTRARITDSGAGLTLSTTTLDLLPTEELTYTVRLNQAPTANVTVTPASSATGKATVSSALTFTSTNWETPQPVTVTGVAAGSATITHTVTSTDTAYTNLSNLPRLTARVTAAATTFALLVKESGLSTATAEEGDTVVLELTADTIAPSGGTQFNAVWTETPDPIVGTVGVTASHTALTVTASGAGNTSTYTVRLNTQPTASVTITPTSGTPANATVSPASRMFTTSNWATPQEFTVTGVLAGSSTITHAVTSTDTSYDGATIDDVTVTVAASAATPGGLTLSTNAPMNRVNEGGSLLVIARLNQAAPTGGTTVTLTVDSASTAETTDYNLPTTISIAAGKTTGRVTLTTQQDNDPDNENIVLTVAATSPTLSGTGLTVTIVDDERGVTVTVPEGKRRVDASIRLPDDSTPSVGVKRIAVRGSGPSMWTARSGKGSVRISYTDDDGGEATVAFGNNAARNNAYQATVMEDVSGGTLTVPVTVSGAVDEAMTFTVRALPDSTAREASSCPATPTATQDFRIANKTVTIAAGQTSTNLTIQICNDAFGEPNETIRLGFTPAPATARNVEDLFQRRPAGNLQAVITIDSEDVPTSVRLAAGAFQDATGSEGGQVEMRATLDRPADQGGVTVTLTLKSGVASTATSADYRLPAAFTIPAGETSATAVVRLLPDEVVDGEKVLRLTATTSPSLTVTFATPPNPALATNVLLNRQYVEIVIRDADSPGLNLSRSSLTVAAGQQSEPYTVRLNSRPTANVTVAIAVDPAANATVSPTTLTFTTQNWRTVQPVRVRGRTVGAATVTATATSTDANYNNRTATLTLRVTAPTSTPSPPPPPPPPGPTGGGGPPPPGPTGGGGGEPTDDEPTGDEPAGDEPVGGFSDLDRAGRSHIVAVTNLVSRGVLDGTGCGGGQLCPREPIRRWEMAVWLVRIIDGQDPAQPTEPRFEDVGTDLWWAGHAERLAELGITLGCSTEPLEYCPDRPVTRAQMASFLVRAFEIAAAEVAGFEDTTNNTHRANIDALAAAGITLGCATDPPSFCPRDPTTRAQMASFLTRVLETREQPTQTGYQPKPPAAN